MIPGSTVVFIIVYFGILSYYNFVDVDLDGMSESDKSTMLLWIIVSTPFLQLINNLITCLTH